MRLIVRLIAVASTLVALVPTTAAAQGFVPQDGYWYCYTQADLDPVYVTPVWDAKAIPMEVQAEFKKVLAAKYGYKENVFCATLVKASPENSLAKSEAALKQSIAGWQKSGKKIVQTGWTSAQPPIGPPAPQWTACSAMILPAGAQPNTPSYETYVTAAYDAGDATVQVQQDAFGKFLRTKYGITTTDLHPYCVPVESEARALAAIKVWSDNGRVRGKVIETGWKFGK